MVEVAVVEEKEEGEVEEVEEEEVVVTEVVGIAEVVVGEVVGKIVAVIVVDARVVILNTGETEPPYTQSVPNGIYRKTSALAMILERQKPTNSYTWPVVREGQVLDAGRCGWLASCISDDRRNRRQPWWISLSWGSHSSEGGEGKKVLYVAKRTDR